MLKATICAPGENVVSLTKPLSGMTGVNPPAPAVASTPCCPMDAAPRQAQMVMPRNVDEAFGVSVTTSLVAMPPAGTIAYQSRKATLCVVSSPVSRRVQVRCGLVTVSGTWLVLKETRAKAMSPASSAEPPVAVRVVAAPLLKDLAVKAATDLMFVAAARSETVMSKIWSVAPAIVAV